ncbi:uncharacterized protein [Eleutherodactylus coqui]|uniref:uncharacterized protein n=1 Tax=Eleutherodactylus coqui TaxID=57060 RepID=UPI0034624605
MYKDCRGTRLFAEESTSAGRREEKEQRPSFAEVVAGKREEKEQRAATAEEVAGRRLEKKEQRAATAEEVAGRRQEKKEQRAATAEEVAGRRQEKKEQRAATAEEVAGEGPSIKRKIGVKKAAPVETKDVPTVAETQVSEAIRHLEEVIESVGSPTHPSDPANIGQFSSPECSADSSPGTALCKREGGGYSTSEEEFTEVAEDRKKKRKYTRKKVEEMETSNPLEEVEEDSEGSVGSDADV